MPSDLNKGPKADSSSDKALEASKVKAVIPPTPTKQAYMEEGAKPLGWLNADEPISLFQKWLIKAGEVEVNDPNAMSLATVDESGQPDVRIVLLKAVNARGFVFYTNANSAKGTQLKASRQAALCFHWKGQRRQVRIRGAAEPVSNAESDAYFQERARGSQIGAWASAQSAPAQSRDEMIKAVEAVNARFEGEMVTRPEYWYGWRVLPDTIEFWQDGAFRLHDRIVFTREDTHWTKTRLFP